MGASTVSILGAGQADGSLGIQFGTGGGYGLNHPTNKPSWGEAFDEITFVISVGAIYGAPTTWSVDAKIQLCQPHTYNFQFQKPVWFDLQPEQVDNCIVEKCGFYGGSHNAPLDGDYGTIADYTDAAPTADAPITVQRTIRSFGHSARIALRLPSTGGTSPRCGLSVTAILREY